MFDHDPLLLLFSNAVLKICCFLETRIKILDAILEKVKGHILRKLRVRQVLEVDDQFLMRLCVEFGNDINIESD